MVLRVHQLLAPAPMDTQHDMQIGLARTSKPLPQDISHHDMQAEAREYQCQPAQWKISPGSIARSAYWLEPPTKGLKTRWHKRCRPLVTHSPQVNLPTMTQPAVDSCNSFSSCSGSCWPMYCSEGMASMMCTSQLSHATQRHLRQVLVTAISCGRIKTEPCLTAIQDRPSMLRCRQTRVHAFT